MPLSLNDRTLFRNILTVIVGSALPPTAEAVKNAFQGASIESSLAVANAISLIAGCLLAGSRLEAKDRRMNEELLKSILDQGPTITDGLKRIESGATKLDTSIAQQAATLLDVLDATRDHVDVRADRYESLNIYIGEQLATQSQAETEAILAAIRSVEDKLDSFSNNTKPSSPRKTVVIVAEIPFDKWIANQSQNFMGKLQLLADDFLLEINSIEEGSVVVTLTTSIYGLDRLVTMESRGVLSQMFDGLVSSIGEAGQYATKDASADVPFTPMESASQYRPADTLVDGAVAAATQKATELSRTALAERLLELAPLIRRRIRFKLSTQARRLIDIEDLLSTVLRRIDVLFAKKALHAQSDSQLITLVLTVLDNAIIDRQRLLRRLHRMEDEDNQWASELAAKLHQHDEYNASDQAESIADIYKSIESEDDRLLFSLRLSGATIAMIASVFEVDTATIRHRWIKLKNEIAQKYSNEP